MEVSKAIRFFVHRHVVVITAEGAKDPPYIPQGVSDYILVTSPSVPSRQDSVKLERIMKCSHLFCFPNLRNNFTREKLCLDFHTMCDT